MEFFAYFITGLAAYLLGSIPTGYVAGKIRGIDIRTVGSGNIGATNVFRILGKKAGIIVLLVDFLKGLIACCCISKLALNIFGATNFGNVSPENLPEYLKFLTGVCAILGHNYTCWLKFKGGKGVATTAGVLAALFPITFAVALGLWLIVFAISKYVSLASIIAAASLPITEFIIRDSTPKIVVALFMGALAIYKHKANIQRLRAGTENRFGKKKPATTEQPK